MGNATRGRVRGVRALLAALVAGVVALVLCAGAALADETSQYTITVTNAHAGQTYTAYKVFDVTTNGEGGYSYSLNNSDNSKDDFIEAVNGAISDLLVKQGDSGSYLVDTEKLNQDSVKSLVAIITENTKCFGGGVSVTAGEGDTSVIISVSELGYYYVSTTTGTLCSLDTATGTGVEIQDKNGVPTLTKGVKLLTGDDATKAEPDAEGYTDSISATVGDKVGYKVEITLPEGSTNITLHDTCPDGVTLDASSIVVRVNGVSLTEVDDYTVNPSPEDGCAFELTLKESGINKALGVAASGTVVVTYSGTLNTNASDNNPNTAYVTFGTANTSSASATATVHTWSFSVKKVDGNNTDKPLAGARFALSTTKDRTGVIKFKADDSTDTAGVKTYCVSADGSETITTTDDGTFKLRGLKSGTYYLLEIEAPQGYNPMKEPQEVIVDEHGNISHENNTVLVLNYSGKILPSTGGIGTTVFYVVGGILVVGAVVALVTKKKMSARK